MTKHQKNHPNLAPSSSCHILFLTLTPMSGSKQLIRHYRSIWISDIHLGTAGCKADSLLHFLRSCESEYLFLVGDIVDGWRLKKKWYWPQSHNDVVQKFLRKCRKGTKVFYIPGNHDAAARDYIDTSFGGIHIKQDYIHTTADGRKFWITHGDLFDGVMQHAPWLAYIGDSAYTALLVINRWFNKVRQLRNLPYWSLSQYVKNKVKRATSFIAAYENLMAKEAKKRNCHGVICGHIHRAEITQIEDVLYINDGDWVESLSALVEHETGELEIIYWEGNSLSPSK